MYVTTLAFQSHANVMQQQPQLQRQAPASLLLSQSLNSHSVSPVSESITFHKGCRAASKTYYVPNPSTISANSKVTWNIKVIEPHTATATATATATDGSFDIGIIKVGSSG